MSGMFVKRQQRVRVLEELERRAKAFRTDEDLYPLRVPREPLPLVEVIEQALPEQHSAFDPLSLRQRTLLHLAWDDGSTWELWVTVLPSGLKLFCDSGEEESRVLALDKLERAVSERSGGVVYVNLSPIYDGLRTHPRFKALVARIGLPAPPPTAP